MELKYIKKYVTSLMIVVLFTGILTSCGKEVKETKKKTISSDSEQLINLSAIGNDDNQSQSYWEALGHNIAKAEKGYYFLSDYGQYLMYFD